MSRISEILTRHHRFQTPLKTFVNIIFLLQFSWIVIFEWELFSKFFPRECRNWSLKVIPYFSVDLRSDLRLMMTYSMVNILPGTLLRSHRCTKIDLFDLCSPPHFLRMNEIQGWQSFFDSCRFIQKLVCNSWKKLVGFKWET